MNQAHFHLIVNHFPIIIPILGILILAGGFIVRSEIVKRTAFCVFIFGALCTVPAFVTGEGAEEVVEHLQGVNKQVIHAHEEAAKVFAILAYLLGGLSLLALWANWKQKSFANIMAIAVIVFSLVVLFFAKQTGTTGGEIRHTEIRSGASQALPPSTRNKEQDDD